MDIFYKNSKKAINFNIAPKELYDQLKRDYKDGIVTRRGVNALYVCGDDYIWYELNDNLFINYIQTIASAEDKLRHVRISTMVEAFKTIKALTIDKCDITNPTGGVFNLAAKNYGHILPFKGAFYDIQKMKLVKPAPKYYKTTHIPFIIDEDEDMKPNCPNWESILEYIYEGNTELISIIQEMFGYCLLGDCRYTKMFFLHGDGGSGKSVILRVLRYMLNGGSRSEGNTSAIPIDSINESHATEGLIGKMANITDESSRFLRDSAQIIKQIASGDTISINPKGRPRYDATMTIKIIVSSNDKPNFNEINNAIKRRLVIIPHKRIISGTKDDNNRIVEEKILGEGELKEVLKWAIQGLRRLLINNKFTVSADSEREYQEMLRENDNVALFFDDCLICDERAKAPNSQLRHAWDEWAKKNNIKTCPKDFIKRIAKYSQHGEQVRMKHKGIVERGVSKVRIKNHIDYLNEAVEEDLF